jgi:hypothetical protein
MFLRPGRAEFSARFGARSLPAMVGRFAFVSCLRAVIQRLTIIRTGTDGAFIAHCRSMAFRLVDRKRVVARSCGRRILN